MSYSKSSHIKQIVQNLVNEMIAIAWMLGGLGEQSLLVNCFCQVNH